MQIIFMGTPDFAVPCLSALLDAGHTVSLVVTQPDKPKGRGHKLAPPPVKAFAAERGIPVYQPATLRDGTAEEVLASHPADVYVVVAYGKILPPSILALPPKGCINVHASLLPKYRGAAPIQWSILSGETQTGVTTMFMEEWPDAGNMLLHTVVDITPEETGSSLHDKLSEAGAALIVKTLDHLDRGLLVPRKQIDAHATYAPMIDKTTATIDFTRPAREVCNLIRGMNAFPMARTTYHGKLLKIIRATADDHAGAGGSGKVLAAGPEGIRVACGAGSILILELQLEGGKRLPAADFLRGHPMAPGERLGE